MSSALAERIGRALVEKAAGQINGHFNMRSFSRLFSWLAQAVVWIVPVTAVASIDLIPKEVVITSDPVSVQVVNNGVHPEYVSISLSRLLNPGVPLDDERLEPIGEAAQPTLYAYPFRMSLAPGQTKSITLKPLRPVETETVFRLKVRPEVKLLESGQKKSANVVAKLGFSGLVRQLPARIQDGLSVACEATGATLTASGNVRHRVEGVKVDGRDIESFNVYPGVPHFVPGHVVEIPGHPVCHGAAAN